MSDMSDLDLVAQAMAPIDNPQPKSANIGKDLKNSKDSNTALPSKFNNPSVEKKTPVEPELPDLSQIPQLADLDPNLLASLSIQDRQALLPLLQALQRADTALHPDGAPAEAGEEGDMGDMAEILKAMDAAGEVADELEGKLDRLIASLGEEEKGLGGELREKKGKE